MNLPGANARERFKAQSCIDTLHLPTLPHSTNSRCCIECDNKPHSITQSIRMGVPDRLMKTFSPDTRSAKDPATLEQITLISSTIRTSSGIKKRWNDLKVIPKILEARLCIGTAEARWHSPINQRFPRQPCYVCQIMVSTCVSPSWNSGSGGDHALVYSFFAVYVRCSYILYDVRPSWLVLDSTPL